MALTSGTGAGLTLVRNVDTGRYDFTFDSTKNPAFGNTGEDLVLSLLLEFRGKYWGDETDGRRGSTLHEIKHDISGTLSQILQAIDLALQLAVSDGRLLSFARTCTRRAPGRYDVSISWKMPNGITGTTPLPLGY